MKSLLIYTLVLFTTLSQVSNAQHEVKITGTISGYPSNTEVVLINFETQSFSDTAYIMNGFFNFRVMNYEPAYYGIQVGKGSRPEMVNFFVEDTDVSIYGRNGELERALVKGGTVQSDFDDFTTMNEPITIRFDKAHEEFNQAYQENKLDKADSLKKVVLDIRQERINFAAQYINNNPDKILSAFILKGSIPGLPKTEIDSLYENLSPTVKESSYGNSIAIFLGYNKSIKIDDVAEDFELLDISGNTVSLKTFKNKYILLDFWSAGCGSCRIENRNLVKYYQQYKNKGLEIISISTDVNPKMWKSATKEDLITWSSLQDSKDDNGHVRLRYGVRFIPANFIIEPNGRILAKDLYGEELKEKLKEIFE